MRANEKIIGLATIFSEVPVRHDYMVSVLEALRPYSTRKTPKDNSLSKISACYGAGIGIVTFFTVPCGVADFWLVLAGVGAGT